MKNLILFLLIIVLAGCSVSKRCAEPDIELPYEIVDGFNSDSICIADLHWSKIFSDTLLHNLIVDVLEHNKDLLTATAKVEEMEKLNRITKANRLPSIGAEAYVERETNDKSGSNSVEDIEVAAKLTLSWEIDFFGRLKWANKESLANYIKTVEGHRSLQMTLIAEVAISYFELMALDNELEIITRTLETREEDLNKAKLRFEGGLTSEIPYQQAKVEYTTTASLIPDLQKKIEIKENEISLLTGKFPHQIRRSKIQRTNLNSELLHIGIPSDLIKRRPDLKAAEQSLKATMAKAGYSWAERFPRFVITLEGGLENDGFSKFFTAPLTYMLGELTSPIFDFGKRKSKYEAAIKAYDAERYQYEKKVITAFKEVNDAVIAYTSANKKVSLMQNLKSSSHKYLELALFQYINGHINYIDVLDAQRSYLNAEINHSNAIKDEYIALITLYKSLGGGWGND